MATIRTRNRKLEQVLFALGEHHIGWEKDDDGMTVWIYPNTDKIRQIIAWFHDASDRRTKGGW